MPEESYIRGAPAGSIDPKRVGRVLAYVVVLALAGTAIGLALIGSSSDSTASRLKHRGVPVQATVTTCIGISSGIGMGVEYYNCSGRYTLNGQSFVEVIHGSRADLTAGTTVSALVIPGDPASLALPGSAHTSSSGAWIAAGVVAVAAGMGAGWLAILRIRRRGTRRRSESVPAPT